MLGFHRPADQYCGAVPSLYNSFNVQFSIVYIQDPFRILESLEVASQVGSAQVRNMLLARWENSSGDRSTHSRGNRDDTCIYITEAEITKKPISGYVK